MSGLNMRLSAVLFAASVLIYCFDTVVSFTVNEDNLDTANLHLRSKRKAVSKDGNLWPNGLIPYILTDDISSDAVVMSAILGSINTIEADTCIRFKQLDPRDTNDPMLSQKYVRFVKAEGCHSSVGNTDSTNYQEVSIGSSCGYPEMVLHELGHLVGMAHEHCRPDRDAHIIVNWNNIYPGMAYNFDKISDVRLLTPYDLSSVMHYGKKVFSKDKMKLQSFIPMKEELSFLVGYRHDLSFYDQYTINTLYKCSAYCSRSAPVCENEGFLNKYCRCVCPRLFTGDRCQAVITDIECGGVVDVDGTTFITSPNYPRNYDNSRSCVWHLKSAKHKLMSLTFEDFDLETGRMGTCRDQLEIRDHYIGLARGHVYCGNELNKTFTTTTNHLILNFMSNSFETRRGFKAKIELIDRKDCSNFPCQNGGVCKQMDYYNDYYCECRENWIGRHCDMPVVNGGLSEWSSWSQCTAACGLQCRHRQCNNPAPQNGGIECSAVMKESRRCQSEFTNCTGQFTCDFSEQTMCGMIAEGNSGLQWTQNEGSTESKKTGPSKGHFGEQNDGYVYMESSYGLFKEETILWLPITEWRVGIYCLQFYYHMHGMTTGSLRILRASTGTLPSQVLWQSSNDHGDAWNEANVNVLLYDGLKVGFVGIKGRGYYSDIALDDISLSPRGCAFPRNSYARGCQNGTDFYHVGPMTYTTNCKRYSCFCNPDGRIDCPQFDYEEVCTAYSPYEMKVNKLYLLKSSKSSRKNNVRKLRQKLLLSKKQNRRRKLGKRRRKSAKKAKRLQGSADEQ